MKRCPPPFRAASNVFSMYIIYNENNGHGRCCIWVEFKAKSYNLHVARIQSKIIDFIHSSHRYIKLHYESGIDEFGPTKSSCKVV